MNTIAIPKKEEEKNSSLESSTLLRIIKRSGRKAAFQPKKIVIAVEKALLVTGEGTTKEAKKVAKKVVALLEKEALKFKKNSDKEYIPNIESVQDTVEKVLMVLDFEETAKAYILYREKRRQAREARNSLQDAIRLVDDYLGELDWKTKENANMAYSLQGLNNYISSAVSAKYWMSRIYPEEIRNAHEEGDFHIHDLQAISAYCCGWDLQDLLHEGFTGVDGKVSCSPAKHFSVALGQIVNFIYTLQGEAAGAEAFSNFDTLLAPFVRYDNLSYKQVKQEMQSFVFNMNVSTRVGFQTPFSNITLDMTPPSTLRDESVVIGGVPQKEKYGEFQKEMDMINRAFAEVMCEGDSSGRIFTFPIPTYNITKNFPWEDKRFDPIWEMTAKYGIPYFANFVNSDMSPDDARSMCCRLRLNNKELRKRGGGLFGANPLTGSIGVVTINLPRLGYISQDMSDFYEKLDHLMDLAKESLEIKRNAVEHLTKKGLYPYTKFYLRNIYKRFSLYWSNHFSTIGIVGMNEALLNLVGEPITTEKGNFLAQEVLEHMRDRIINYQKETGNMYNLEATPAEGTSYRLALKDKAKFDTIIFANDEDVRKHKAEPYYTNSSQLPVGHTQDIFEALDLQDNLQTKYTGGTVLHGFLGERLSKGTQVRDLVKKISHHYHLPYFSITPTFSICPEHGYLSGEVPICPFCVVSGVSEKLQVKKKENNT
ncbi:MAG: ribonucleoside triphosphate reductase [Candidatus Moraniibacteriota bacterium]|nr:MAG: ribonucleoside triphosphate reductase [Candidatus Moranbacteria bacterium]